MTGIFNQNNNSIYTKVERHGLNKYFICRAIKTVSTDTDSKHVFLIYFKFPAVLFCGSV